MQPNIQIRVTELVTEIYEQYRPEVGKVYDAEKGTRPRKRKNATDFVIVPIGDKRIVLRKGEYEIVGV